MKDIWIVMEKYTGNFCGAFTDKRQAKSKCGEVNEHYVLLHWDTKRQVEIK